MTTTNGPEILPGFGRVCDAVRPLGFYPEMTGALCCELAPEPEPAADDADGPGRRPDDDGDAAPVLWLWDNWDDKAGPWELAATRGHDGAPFLRLTLAVRRGLPESPDDVEVFAGEARRCWRAVLAALDVGRFLSPDQRVALAARKLIPLR